MLAEKRLFWIKPTRRTADNFDFIACAQMIINSFDPFANVSQHRLASQLKGSGWDARGWGSPTLIQDLSKEYGIQSRPLPLKNGLPFEQIATFIGREQPLVLSRGNRHRVVVGYRVDKHHQELLLMDPGFPSAANASVAFHDLLGDEILLVFESLHTFLKRKEAHSATSLPIAKPKSRLRLKQPVFAQKQGAKRTMGTGWLRYLHELAPGQTPVAEAPLAGETRQRGRGAKSGAMLGTGLLQYAHWLPWPAGEHIGDA